MFNTLLVSPVEQGLLYAFLALGVYLSFRVLGFPDLTVQGSFPLGAAIAARMIAGNISPLAGTLAALAGGALAGAATGLLHTRLRINNVIASILTMTAAYSVTLRVMGRANQPLLNSPTVFGMILGPLHIKEESLSVIAVSAVVVVLAALLFNAFLHTEVGLTIRATGDNERMMRAFGGSTDNVKVLALAIANALAALSGAVVAQDQGFADAGMGIGVLVIGAAAVIIGESLLGDRGPGWMISAALLGIWLYQLIIALALQVGLAATDLQLITALLVTIALSFPNVRRAIFVRT
ncbi:MAG: ABC transporter permease [Chloroflexi bacterium]|nr:ABC transporter permease [Chloroflexota bacterium]